MVKMDGTICVKCGTIIIKPGFNPDTCKWCEVEPEIDFTVRKLFVP
ncbi:hypothetical protein HY640_03745 [Candidatus Woesearchaeota archaeon]|nr:hypothetical protein [Candidatus Woesearchaeota archaeon]